MTTRRHTETPELGSHHRRGSDGARTEQHQFQSGSSLASARSFFIVLRKSWVLVCVCAVLGAAFGLGFAVLYPKTYAATTSMYISAQTPDTATAAYQGGLLSQTRATSYVELLGGPRVASQVVSELSLPYTTTEMQARLQASSKIDSVLLDLRVTDKNPETAVAVAAQIGRIFPAIVNEIERPNVPGRAPAVALRVVQPAVLDDDAVWPPGIALCAVLGTALGLAGGVGIALIKQTFSQRAENSGEIAIRSGTTDLGSIPLDDAGTGNGYSSFGEALRRLRTNLHYMRVDDPPRVLAITSAGAGEGKTTVAIGLTRVLAAAGSRVLLVDADLRRPTIHKQLGLAAEVGVSSIIADQLQLDLAVQRDADRTFDFVASGPTPPNPSELLDSKQMSSLLRSARSAYDLVIVDTPPVLPVADTLALAGAVDGVVLVARHRTSNVQRTAEAANALRAVGAPLLGVTLNGVPLGGRGSSKDYYSTYESTPVGPRRTPEPYERRGEPEAQTLNHNLGASRPSPSPRSDLPRAGTTRRRP